MNKFLRGLLFIFVSALIVLCISDKQYRLIHISNYNLGKMSGDPFFTSFFILVGFSMLVQSILFLRDENYARAIITNTKAKFWSLILGAEKAMTMYRATAPLAIALSIVMIIFGIVLFFI